MAGGCNFSFWATVVVLALFVGEHLAAAEIQCSDAVTKLLPCEPYLLEFWVSKPSIGFCSAVQSLSKIANASRADKKAMCVCFKAAAKTLPINFDKAAQLSTLCHISLDVPIRPDVDCDRV